MGESNSVLEQDECDIRDYGKKVHGFEIEFDETLDKLNKANESYEEKDKMHKEVEADIAALSRRIMLMEEESKKAEVNLANTVTKLALSSKQADEVSEEGEGCGKQVHEQRGHPGGAGQEPEADHQDGQRQRAEAGRAHQEARSAGGGAQESY